MENEVLNVKENRLSICLFITAMCACAFSVALGLVVLVGWYTGNKTLIQVLPGFVPMQYNTALGFVLCGSGMSLVLFKKQYSAVIIGSLPIVIGGLTRLEYSMGLNLGIDELFMKHPIVVETSHPGRMAPNTATCFVLIGSFLVFHVFFRKQIYKYQLEAIFASLALGLGIVALSGYMIHLETAYGWGSLTRMAVHTSIGFVALGVGALALIWREGLINRKTALPLWFAVPTAIGTITVTICFWQALQSEYVSIAGHSDVPVLTGLSRLSYATLISGVLFAIALALAVYFAQISIRRTRETTKANQILTNEITERKRIEDKLLESEEQFRLISTSANDAIIMLDNDEKISYWNKAAVKIFGYLKEETEGKNIHSLIIPERYRKKHLEGFERFKTIGTGNLIGKTVEVEAIRKDGSEILIELSLSAVKRGGKWNAIGMVRDITERKKAEEEINHLASFPQLNINPILEVNISGAITFHNDATCKVLEKLGLKEDLNLFLPEDINEVLKGLRAKKKSQLAREVKIGSSTFEENIYLIPEFKVARIYARDITDRKRTEAVVEKTLEERNKSIKEIKHLMEFSSLMRDETSESELIKHMAQTLRNNFQPDLLAVLMLDRKEGIIEVSFIEPKIPANKLIKEEAILDPSLCRVLRTGQKFIVRDITKDPFCDCIIHRHTTEDGGYACLPIIAGGGTVGMVLLTRKEKDYWADEEREKLLSTYVGIAASALHNVRLTNLTKAEAVTDALTGVYNRRFFDEILKKQLSLASRHKRSMGLLIADIDHFKDFNDNYGHMAGDHILQRVTKIMKNSIRGTDILARYGGEEFAIIMPETVKANVIKKADKIRLEVESANFDNIVSGQSLKLTISIGAASFPEHGAEYDTLIAAADKALYKAKENGRNKVEIF